MSSSNGFICLLFFTCLNSSAIEYKFFSITFVCVHFFFQQGSLLLTDNLIYLNRGDFNLNNFQDGVVSSAFMVGLLVASPIFASFAKR